MSSAIKVENLSKKYLINHSYSKSESLATALTSGIRTLSDKFLNPGKQDKSDTEEFWALQGINFNIQAGDKVGIIGSNGAGKSTLLKILSRITPPTTGKVTLNGRVSSLLEVGTGFHPDLTGRENIYLNGAILGMSRSEIKRKFDDIVAFSEVEKFLDTPVKRYSSGMYVRLAFAVAAHLEPEILIIDEVLAVGDAAFQKKCLGRMNEVASDGRTVLFVSHNLSAIQQLCDSAIYLKEGQLVEYVKGVEQVEQLLSRYIVDNSAGGEACWESKDSTIENPWFSPKKMYLCDNDGNIHKGSASCSAELWCCIEGIIEEPTPELAIGYVVFNEFDSPIYASKISDTAPETWPKLEKGYNRIKSRIPPHFLNEGRYKFKLVANVVGRKLWLFKPRETNVSVEIQIQGGLSKSPHWNHKRLGVVAPVIQWYSEKS